MSSDDYFQCRLRHHHAGFLKLLELHDAKNPAETLKAYARTLKEDLVSDVKLARASDLNGRESHAYRAMHATSCWLGPLLTHNPSNPKWGRAVATAENELALGISRIR